MRVIAGYLALAAAILSSLLLAVLLYKFAVHGAWLDFSDGEFADFEFLSPGHQWLRLAPLIGVCAASYGMCFWLKRSSK